MDLSNIGKLDSTILLGIVNEKLRIECDSLDELTAVYDMDSHQLESKLDQAGFRYDPLTNQFKSC